MAVPASRYRVSDRAFPETLPTVEYAPDIQVRRVNPVGQFSFRGRIWKISEAFQREPIGLRPTTTDGKWTIHYCGTEIGVIDLKVVKAGSTSPATVDKRPRPQLGEAALNKTTTLGTGP